VVKLFRLCGNVIQCCGGMSSVLKWVRSALAGSGSDCGARLRWIPRLETAKQGQKDVWLVSNNRRRYRNLAGNGNCESIVEEECWA
jgi:hypothetical protein